MGVLIQSVLVYGNRQTVYVGLAFVPVCRSVAACLGMSQPVTIRACASLPHWQAARLGAGRTGAEWTTEPGAGSPENGWRF